MTETGRRGAASGGRRPARAGGTAGSRRAPQPTGAARRLETRARARALQALYAWDVRCTARGAADAGADARLPLVAAQVWEDLGVAPEERRAARRLMAVLSARRPALDDALSAIATNWRLERMSVIDRSLLRLGAAELAGSETPARVVIQEAVHLAERYGSEQSVPFVNGVLDALARRSGRL